MGLLIEGWPLARFQPVPSHTSTRVQHNEVECAQIRLRAITAAGMPRSVHAALVVLAGGVSYQLIRHSIGCVR